MKTKLKRWSKISGTLLFKNKYFEIFRDKVRLPDGRKYDYYLNHRHDRAVIILPLDSQGRILIVKEYRYPVGRVIYNSVGGSVEKHETPLQAAMRELKEETGFRAGAMKLLGTFYANPSRSGTIFYAYLATGLIKGKAQPELMEFLETEFLPQKKVESMIKKGEIKEPFFMVAYLLYKLNSK